MVRCVTAASNDPDAEITGGCTRVAPDTNRNDNDDGYSPWSAVICHRF
jgi:hypothetical protein